VLGSNSINGSKFSSKRIYAGSGPSVPS